jgi:hypothetical protein
MKKTTGVRVSMNLFFRISFLGLGCLSMGLLAAERVALPASNVSSADVRSVNAVYLLIGQSNMAGRGKYHDGDTFESGRIYTLNKQDKLEKFGRYPWVNEYSTIRKSAAQISPGYMFAKEMAKACPQKNICLLSNARGGSAIEEWAKGTKYYQEAIRRTREAMKQGTLKAILWHQGETNYEAILRKGREHEAVELERYFQNLRLFITNLRADLGVGSDVPFIAGQLLPRFKPFNDFLKAKLPNPKENIYLVTSQGLTTEDGLHFDRNSVLEIGKRYAEKVLAAQERETR